MIVAQMVLTPIVKMELEEENELPKSIREGEVLVQLVNEKWFK